MQQEFEARVKMTVSSKEFMSINEVYMNSDLDKDEFCKEWVKMNRKRVDNALAEEKERQRLSAIKDKAWGHHRTLPLQLQGIAEACVRYPYRQAENILRKCRCQGERCGGLPIPLHHAEHGGI